MKGVCPILLTLVLLVVMMACRPPEPRHEDGRPVRVGVLPDQSVSELRTQYALLVEYLAAETGLEFELAIPEDYDELLVWFHDGRIELAWFGGMTFLSAERESGARPLVMRDVDLAFTTDFLVARSREEQSLKELAGATFSFGPPLSTSGHMMPRYYLKEQGIEPESFYADVRHSSAHDETALWVQDGRVDVGAVNSIVVDSMLRDGRLSEDRVRVVEETTPYRDYVWAVRPQVPLAVGTAIQDAFLSLEASDPEHAAILSAHGALGYVPASGSDYDELRRAVELVSSTREGAS